ncbi:nitrogen regulation protein NR(II) [Pelomicrobium sp.]|uniref:nitrogen regulation protein NR(II) n=1 Tax=Pelomicrobium sp. TaxID=2815319 RepID=UPI002FDC89BB
MPSAPFPGLDLLATAVLLLKEGLQVGYANPAAENLFALSRKQLEERRIGELFPECGQLLAAIAQARKAHSTYIEHELALMLPSHGWLHVSCSVTPVELEDYQVLLEFQPIDQHLKIDREERMLNQTLANRVLIRNLAHEIKNPLGGIRGAAQLLDRELELPALHEYTQVIIKEADRLQALMDRLLAPNRVPRFAPLNIHEVLERVRSLILAEYPSGLRVVRDYDVSLPELTGDREQLIQAVLNIVRNAAQALKGKGTITLRTRVARQVTVARRRHRLALTVQIIDDGPGIPEALRDKLFLPLVSGREDGHGLGLALAHHCVAQHHGTIEWESAPGRTCFTLVLPLLRELRNAWQ